MDKAIAKYKIIDEILNSEDNLLNVSMLCNTAGVSRQGYYYWLKNKESREKREEQDLKDFEIVLEAYSFRGYAKGARGIHMRLLHLEIPIVMNHKKISANGVATRMNVLFGVIAPRICPRLMCLTFTV